MVENVGVIGSGTMGAGITISLINSGTPVTVVETSQEALDRGYKRMLDTWARREVGPHCRPRWTSVWPCSP